MTFIKGHVRAAAQIPGLQQRDSNSWKVGRKEYPIGTNARWLFQKFTLNCSPDLPGPATKMFGHSADGEISRIRHAQFSVA